MPKRRATIRVGSLDLTRAQCLAIKRLKNGPVMAHDWQFACHIRGLIARGVATRDRAAVVSLTPTGEIIASYIPAEFT